LTDENIILVKTIHKNRLELEETAALLTDLGLEVEVVEKYQSIKGLEGIVVGHVLTCVPHPDADRLK
jgi:phenylalanyl-tRNA synthetase beta chain